MHGVDHKDGAQVRSGTPRLTMEPFQGLGRASYSRQIYSKFYGQDAALGSSVSFL